MNRTQQLQVFYHLAAEQRQAIDWANGWVGTAMLGDGKAEFLEIAQGKLDEINEARERFISEGDGDGVVGT